MRFRYGICRVYGGRLIDALNDERRHPMILSETRAVEALLTPSELDELGQLIDLELPLREASPEVLEFVSGYVQGKVMLHEKEARNGRH